MSACSKLGVVLVATAIVAGCGATPSDPVVAAPGEASTALERGTRPYIGKPRPPVAVALVPGPRLESGVPGRLTLQVSSRIPLDAVQLVVEGDEGLTVVEYEEVPGTEGARHQAASFEISATPVSGGTRYLSGFLSFEVNGVSQGVPFRLPVEVGGPVTVAPLVAKPERLPVRDATGEIIDSMPAETTVR